MDKITEENICEWPHRTVIKYKNLNLTVWTGETYLRDLENARAIARKAQARDIKEKSLQVCASFLGIPAISRHPESVCV